MFLMSPVSSYCYELMKTISPKRVPSTWPPNCSHIILTHSAETPVWYFVNMLLFQVQKLFNWFSKYVWLLVAHFCVNSCFHLWYEKKILKISGWTDTNNDSSKNINVIFDINKLCTNKRCHFLENIVPINETSEQNSNGYCKADFVFTLDPTNASCISGIKVIFSYHEFIFMFKMQTFRPHVS